jgi:hypothetical protein
LARLLITRFGVRAPDGPPETSRGYGFCRNPFSFGLPTGLPIWSPDLGPVPSSRQVSRNSSQDHSLIGVCEAKTFCGHGSHTSPWPFSGSPAPSRGKPGWFDRHPRSLGRRRCGIPETRENLVSEKKLCYRAGQTGFPGPQGPGRPGKPNLVLMSQRQGTPR